MEPAPPRGAASLHNATASITSSSSNYWPPQKANPAVAHAVPTTLKRLEQTEARGRAAARLHVRMTYQGSFLLPMGFFGTLDLECYVGLVNLTTPAVLLAFP